MPNTLATPRLNKSVTGSRVVIGGVNEPGFPVGNGMGTASSLTSFGHFGQNSSMLWGDSAHDVVVVMTTYLILSAEEISHRFPEIADSV